MRQVLVALVLVLLVGCSSFGGGGYYSDVAPTVESVSEAGGVQVYGGTAYLASDFKPSGELRAFGDYDFMVESAPCTVLPVYRPGDEWFKVGGGLYQCRANISDGKRLLLAGSPPDCDSRTWDMRMSLMPTSRKAGYLCARQR